MKVKLIGKKRYEIYYQDKSIGKFDTYDLDRLNNAQIRASLIIGE